MLRYEVIFQGLQRIKGLTPEIGANANTILDNLLNEFETFAYWRFLETTATISTSASSFAFSATTPSMARGGAGTPFSKGLSVSVSGKNLRECSYETWTDLSDGTTGTPVFFALRDQTVYLYPTPAAATTVTLKYCRTLPNVGNPTASTPSDNLESTVLIPVRYHHSFALYGFPAMAYQFINNLDSYRTYHDMWLRSVMSIAGENKDYFTLNKAVFGKFELASKTTTPEPTTQDK